ncbi:MAG TPA: helix-turn-helix transcriptional regulator [Gammaproteobacteria bacterium]|jgi:transcriptional regulator with XRE-family HTH domain|nr:helix-turn-helix transcriptional regulator [Gammaproteobacteria bacterium]
MKTKKNDFVKAKVHASITPGEALKMLRELQGLSQSELAEMTGMKQSNISHIESGTSQMGRERAIVLAKALRVHPAVLLFPDFDIEDVA